MSPASSVRAVGMSIALIFGLIPPAHAQEGGGSPVETYGPLGSRPSHASDNFEGNVQIEDAVGGPVYRVLATSRTSTLEAELNAASADGYRLHAVMGGDTAVGGSEVVAIVKHHDQAAGRYRYRLLATSRTSTMERELTEAADAGFRYRGQTVFETTFGGEEVVVIVERDTARVTPPVEYRLLAASKTSTLEKELVAAARDGYEVLELTLGRTTFGGDELVALLTR